MAVEALLGTDRAFAADLIALRPQPGQADSAANLRRLLAGSPIVASHRHGDDRVQDAYSLRCAPQVAGAARDTVAHARAVAEAELRSAIDNPMVLPDGRVESCGNFHGAPLGFACDFLAVAVAEIGGIAERRTDRLLDGKRSHGLPPFLTDDPGVNSGLMLAQYTQAAMVAENRRLAAPASVGSLPSSAMQEDHVSMGWGAARKLRTAVANLARILAVELVCAARGHDLRAPLQPGPGTGAALAAVARADPGARTRPSARAGAGGRRGARDLGRAARARGGARSAHSPDAAGASARRGAATTRAAIRATASSSSIRTRSSTAWASSIPLGPDHHGGDPAGRVEPHVGAPGHAGDARLPALGGDRGAHPPHPWMAPGRSPPARTRRRSRRSRPAGPRRRRRARRPRAPRARPPGPPPRARRRGPRSSRRSGTELDHSPAAHAADRQRDTGARARASPGGRRRRSGAPRARPARRGCARSGRSRSGPRAASRRARRARGPCP